MKTNLELSLLPQELLQHMAEYFDTQTLVQARLVNKFWHQVTLYKFYNTLVFPKKFAPQCLYHWLLAYQERIPQLVIADNALNYPFHPMHQKQFFQHYMKEIYHHPVQSTLLEFLQAGKDQLLARHPTEEVENSTVFKKHNLFTREQLLDNWECYPQHIALLFDHVTLHRLSKVFHRTYQSWHAQTNDDLEFIEALYHATHQLESFLSACVIVIKSQPDPYDWNFFKDNPTQLWTRMLTARDLFILEMRFGRTAVIIETAIEVRLPSPGVIYFWHGINPIHALTILKKLTPKSLLQFIWNGLSHGDLILKAVQQRQPEICALLLKMSSQQLHRACLRETELALELCNHPSLLPKISDETLITVFNNCTNKRLIAALTTIAPLLQRLSSTSFLQAVSTLSLWQEGKHTPLNIQIRNRDCFIAVLLSTADIVNAFSLSTIEAYLYSSELSKDRDVFLNLFQCERLHDLNVKLLTGFFATLSPQYWTPVLSHALMIPPLTSADFLSTLDELRLWHHDAQKRATFLHVFLTTDKIIEFLPIPILEKFFLLGYVKPSQAILSTLLQHEKLHALSPQTLITLLSLCPAQDVMPLLAHDIMIKHLTSEEFLNVFDDKELWAQHLQQRAEFLHRLLTTPKLVQALPSAFIEMCFINAYVVPDAALLATLATCKVVHQLTPQCFIFMVNHCSLEEGVAWLSSAMIDYVTSTTFLTAMKDSTLWHKAGESHDLDAIHRQRFINSVLTTPAILQQLSPHVVQHYLHAYDGALDERLLKPLLRYKKLPWDLFLNRYHRDKDLFESLPEVKDYAFELLNHGELLDKAQQNLLQYIQPLLDVLSLALASSQAQIRVCYLLQQPWFMAEVSKATLQSWRRITFSFNAQLISAELTRRDNAITHQRAQLNVWHATQNSQQFPPWSLAVMIGMSMTAMACIMLASLSLGQVDAATQAIDYLHHQLHLTFPTVYTEVGLLVSGIAFYLIIIAASILRKNTYTPYPYPPSLSDYDPFMKKSTLEEKTQNNPYCYGLNAEVEESTELSFTPSLWKPAALPDSESKDEFNPPSALML